MTAKEYLNQNAAGYTDQVRFKGRLLADGKEVYGETGDGHIRETYWDLYQTDDGKYLVYWWHWSSVWFDPSISDYAILDTFPAYDKGFTGTFLGGRVWSMPYHILDRAKAVVEGKEDYHPGI